MQLLRIRHCCLTLFQSNRRVRIGKSFNEGFQRIPSLYYLDSLELRSDLILGCGRNRRWSQARKETQGKDCQAYSVRKIEFDFRVSCSSTSDEAFAHLKREEIKTLKMSVNSTTSPSNRQRLVTETLSQNTHWSRQTYCSSAR
ncbi:MAG: hypothetical protein M2R45_00976 [Verrucomicrobia subdivision 3 bacterium]|nr:hypothetical protein [Limisphaerales bacterium]MCS1414643.1 hypothetical protein [Limisphaerales bacterium]